MKVVEELRGDVPVVHACEALGVPRSSLYRARKGKSPKTSVKPRPAPARALTDEERAEVRDVLCSKEFVDQTPRDVYAGLLDRNQYLCHWRTMYRVLAEFGEVKERRDQLRHPTHPKPVLVARAPNRVWTWDIVRHEALLNRAEVKELRPLAVAAAGEKLGAV
jgi:putative transposase